MMNLAETQKLVWKLITAPEGVVKALEENPMTRLPIKGDHRLSAAQRLDIYANMYFYRIRDALKDDFPRVLTLIGETHFHNLITDYLLAHPSEHWSLRYVGKDLPRFVTTHSLRERWPMIVDLACFEWELIEAFDAADTTPLTREDVAGIDPSRWSELVFRPAPSFRMCTFDVRVDLPSYDPQPVTIVFWRKGLEVVYRPVEPIEKDLLTRMREGATFGELCEIAGEKLASFFQTWIESALLDRGA
ncbi:MAG: putative DNA-binding domain-containing protein [Deltaproteobacteria bacterium]|nr:putative DNA-binding domain-containing protein [Deltaproteobacteria bacterium]